MYYVKVTYDISTDECVFIPVDGEYHGVTQGLSASAKENGDGTFSVETITWERDNPNETALEKKEIITDHTVKAGKKCAGRYSVSDWSYLDGVSYSHPSYRAEVVDGSVALKESSDPVIRAMVCVDMGNYEEADTLLAPILPPNKDHYYFVNRDANKLQAQRYENGLGVEKNLDKAYVHYLYAQSIADVIRFMDMGYGKGVFCESPRLLDLNEYHTLMLLWTAGEREYAEYRINWLASCWIYDSAEKEATKKTEAQEHRTYALCRRQVCEWMMEKNAEDVDIEKFTLFMGAYLSYLKNGHEGSCSYVYEYSDGKCNETSVWAAEKYIAEALEAGKFAIRGKAFMDAVKEAKNE